MVPEPRVAIDLAVAAAGSSPAGFVPLHALRPRARLGLSGRSLLFCSPCGCCSAPPAPRVAALPPRATLLCSPPLPSGCSALLSPSFSVSLSKKKRKLMASSATVCGSTLEREFLPLFRRLNAATSSLSLATAHASGLPPLPLYQDTSSSWFLDSSASFHMTPDSTQLSSLSSVYHPLVVRTAAGTSLYVTWCSLDIFLSCAYSFTCS